MHILREKQKTAVDTIREANVAQAIEGLLPNGFLSDATLVIDQPIY